MRKLTARQQLFAQEYLKDLNAHQAAIRAGYSEKTASRIGPELLGIPWVAEAIQLAMDKRAKRTEVTVDRVLQEYARIAFVDPRKFFDDEGKLIPVKELDEDTARALAGMDYHAEWENSKDSKDDLKEKMGSTTKIKLIDKRGALDSLGKHLNMFIERKEIGKPGDFIELSDDELRERVQARAFRRTQGGPGANAPGSKAESSPVH